MPSFAALALGLLALLLVLAFVGVFVLKFTLVQAELRRRIEATWPAFVREHRVPAPLAEGLRDIVVGCVPLVAIWIVFGGGQMPGGAPAAANARMRRVAPSAAPAARAAVAPRGVATVSATAPCWVCGRVHGRGVHV